MNNVYKLSMLHAAAAQTPRQRRREANLQRILEAAMTLVIEEGFDALSIHRLAKEVDYTPGALYRYFSGKGALIAALTAQVLEDLGAAVRQSIGRVEPQEPIQQALAAAFTYRAFARVAPNRFGLLSLLAADPRMLVPDLTDAEPAIAAMAVAFAPLGQALDEAAAAGQLASGPGMDRAMQAFGTVHGLLQLRKQEGRLFQLADLDGLIDRALASLLRGWGADPEQVQRHLAQVHALGPLAESLGVSR